MAMRQSKKTGLPTVICSVRGMPNEYVVGDDPKEPKRFRVRVRIPAREGGEE